MPRREFLGLAREVRMYDPLSLPCDGLDVSNRVGRPFADTQYFHVVAIEVGADPVAGISNVSGSVTPPSGRGTARQAPTVDGNPAPDLPDSIHFRRVQDISFKQRRQRQYFFRIPQRYRNHKCQRRPIFPDRRLAIQCDRPYCQPSPTRALSRDAGGQVTIDPPSVV
jgi:hypothetical protein